MNRTWLQNMRSLKEQENPSTIPEKEKEIDGNYSYDDKDDEDFIEDNCQDQIDTRLKIIIRDKI